MWHTNPISYCTFSTQMWIWTCIFLWSGLTTSFESTAAVNQSIMILCDGHNLNARCRVYSTQRKFIVRSPIVSCSRVQPTGWSVTQLSYWVSKLKETYGETFSAVEKHRLDINNQECLLHVADQVRLSEFKVQVREVQILQAHWSGVKLRHRVRDVCNNFREGRKWKA